MAYQQALNETSEYIFNQLDKRPTTARLQSDLYRHIRSKYQLGAQTTQSVFRQVKATYQGLWTKIKKNMEHKRLGCTDKAYKGLEKPPFYKGTTMDLVYGKDFSFKSERKVSILTLEGRIVVPFDVWNERFPLLNSTDWKIGTAKFTYCKRKKQFYLLIPVTKAFTIQTEGLNEIVGVDVGVRYLAVTDTNKKPVFFKSGHLKHVKRKYQELRSQLQEKGTRSAKNKLVEISRRERQFTSYVNHLIARITCQNGVLVGIEDLTGIRENTHTYRKNKEDRRQREQWAFADLHSKFSYKSILYGGFFLKVDPAYTSQDCPQCTYRSRKNRPNKGLLFSCQSCGYTLHADLIGAKNIRNKTIVEWHAILQRDVSQPS